MVASVARLLILFLCLVGGAALAGAQPPAKVALILYDATPRAFAWTGELYSLQLGNLLSHFHFTAQRKPVDQYQPGELDGYQATFYLGTLYGTALPSAFLTDVLATNTPVCWLGMNLWQLAWTPAWTNNPAFEARFGFRFEGMEERVYPTVMYQGVALTRPEDAGMLGMTRVLADALVSVPAQAVAPPPHQRIPYIIRGRNLWYVADCPFYGGEFTDRVLAFCDVLHDMLGVEHPTRHRGIIRLEDVSPMAPPDKLRAIADYLFAQRLPFAVAVIPEYRDPWGVYNGGVPLTVKLTDARARPFVETLHYLVARGGTLIQHGTTHQSHALSNPYRGVSGEDYEFFRMVNDGAGGVFPAGPVPEDSAAWVHARVSAGQALFAACGLTPVAWETPHYLASEVDYTVFPQLYRLATDRGVYYARSAAGWSYYQMQSVPFLIPRDCYGQARLPDTLGYLDPAGVPPVLPADLLARARAHFVVRDSWANFYYHYPVDLDYLKATVAGLQALGVQFVALDPAVE
jgi:hypothetical protein